MNLSMWGKTTELHTKVQQLRLQASSARGKDSTPSQGIQSLSAAEHEQKNKVVCCLASQVSEC